MTEKRFTLSKDTEWWFVQDNTIQVNEFGYRDDLTGEDAYRGLQQDLTEQEVVDLLNELDDKNHNLRESRRELITANNQYIRKLNELNDENKELKKESYGNLDDFENYKALYLNLCERYKNLEVDFIVLREENEQLKEEIAKFKEWEKHIGDVKREDLDVIFKMRVYEIAEALEYYRKRIR